MKKFKNDRCLFLEVGDYSLTDYPKIKSHPKKFKAVVVSIIGYWVTLMKFSYPPLPLIGSINSAN